MQKMLRFLSNGTAQNDTKKYKSLDVDEKYCVDQIYNFYKKQNAEDAAGRKISIDHFAEMFTDALEYTNNNKSFEDHYEHAIDEDGNYIRAKYKVANTNPNATNDSKKTCKDQLESIKKNLEISFKCVDYIKSLLINTKNNNIEIPEETMRDIVHICLFIIPELQFKVPASKIYIKTYKAFFHTHFYYYIIRLLEYTKQNKIKIEENLIERIVDLMLERSILRDKEGKSGSYFWYNYDYVTSCIIEYFKKNNIDKDIIKNTGERILDCILQSKTTSNSFDQKEIKHIAEIIVNFKINNPVQKILDAMLRDSECNSNSTTAYCSKYRDYEFIDSMTKLFTMSKENKIEIPENAIKQFIEIICTENKYINLYTKNDRALNDLAESLKKFFEVCKECDINYDYTNTIKKLEILFSHKNQKKDFSSLQNKILSLNLKTNDYESVSSNIVSTDIESNLQNLSLENVPS